MEIKAYKNEFENLKLKGEEAIDSILMSGDQENFYIDFKNISTPKDSKCLSEDDRKNLAKAISGFSNTSGGLIVWGIKDNRNNKFTKSPTENPDNILGLLNDAVSKLSLPVMSGINSFSIKDQNGNGYIITEIPKYYFSPVQVNPSLKIKDIPGRYYIRSGSDFVIANHDTISSLYGRQKQSRMICYWSDGGNDTYIETNDEIKCRLNLVLQNKGNGILRDVWVNYTAGGIKSSIEKTSQINLFTGWNIFGLGLNLITIDNYKLGPQQSINPFLIELTLSKTNLKDGAYIYFSFGADNVSPNEVEVKFNKENLSRFLLLPKLDRNLENFIKRFFNLDEN